MSVPPAAPIGGALHQESCPLCNAPLHADQNWCLRCGTAARTRLAAPPKWKGLAATVTLTAAIALAVLVVALVKIVG